MKVVLTAEATGPDSASKGDLASMLVAEMSHGRSYFTLSQSSPDGLIIRVHLTGVEVSDSQET